MSAGRCILLASASPRRRAMLEETGWSVVVVPTGVDDGELMRPDVSPEAWVMALAHLKARAALSRLERRQIPSDAVIVGADTVCVTDGGEVLGQPRDAAHARAMLLALRGQTHRTLTGVCLLWPADGLARELFWDATIVRVGNLIDEAIDAYVRSNNWRGKAGGYNLSERLEAGWPIACEGDPATVMGLPMRLLTARLDRGGKA